MSEQQTQEQPKTKALKPQEAMRQDIEKMGPQFKAALPNHISVEKFQRVLQTAINSTPGLIEATKTSVLGACMKAAQDGLLPDGREGAIVTFTSNGVKQAQWMPMIGGILKKMRNSGEIASVTSQIVYENDQFDYYIDDEGEHISHRPLMFGERGKKLGAYSLLKTKDGAIYIECMDVKQIEAVKNVSRSKNGPWSGPFEEEMWKKTTLRRLSKRAPMSTDIEQQLHSDDDLFMPEKEVKGKATPVAPKTEALPPPAPTPVEAEIVEEAPPAPAPAPAKKTSSSLRDAVKKKEAAPPQQEEYDRPAIVEHMEEENELDRALSDETV